MPSSNQRGRAMLNLKTGGYPWKMVIFQRDCCGKTKVVATWYGVDVPEMVRYGEAWVDAHGDEYFFQVIPNPDYIEQKPDQDRVHRNPRDCFRHGTEYMEEGECTECISKR